jgi:hypothetical protein
VLCVLIAGTSLRADAIVVTQAMTASTIAEIFIEEGVARVELEIGGQDLPAFHNLMPDAVNERLGFEPEPLAERLPRFFREDLIVRADGGRAAPGRVTQIGPRRRLGRDAITGEPLAAGEDEGEQVIFAVLEYALPKRAGTITIESIPVEERPAAGVGFVAYHLGLPINDFRYLSREQTVDLDWSDPWYSRFRTRNLRRQYDAPLNAFLYVEPFEVRVEVISRPVDVQRWIDLGIEGLTTIPVDLQPSIKQKSAEFFPQHFELTIDGESVTPELDRVHFLRRTLRTSSVVDPPEELEAYSATLGAIYVVPTDGLPQEAKIIWNLFSEKIDTVPAAATDEAGPLRFFLQADDNELWWKNFLKNPTLPTLVDIAAPPSFLARSAPWLAGVAGLAGLALGFVSLRSRGSQDTRSKGRATLAAVLIALAAAIFLWQPSRVDAGSAEEVVGGLLHNIYRAFDYRDESTIYDVLDRSVTGDLLTETFLETRRGLELQSQGGARAKVKEIEMLEVDPQALSGSPGFLARCTWRVAGSVGHWGHVHTRTNQYEADVTVEPVDGVWKITRLDLLQEERI